MPQQALPANLGRLLDSRRQALGPFGAQGRWHAQVGSTNDEAARWAAEGAPEGAFVVADEQTAGRGRRGRTWTSPPGAGLYLSVVFRPDPAAGLSVSNDPATMLLTMMAGVAAAQALRRATGVPVTLKWPNDVMVESGGVGREDATDRRVGGRRWRKLAGILAEATTSGNVLQFMIVGIGVNLRSADWPPEVAARATSLEAMTGRLVDRDVVLVALLESLAEQRQRLLAGGGDALLDEWRALSPSSRGHGVQWAAPEGPRTAVTAGIDAEGALLVETASGGDRIVAGELIWE
jgi:BirA family transcriptional regulator, biotin operon repressor / biotin---[acetyl-CoA-carboxylase] ligase